MRKGCRKDLDLNLVMSEGPKPKKKITNYITLLKYLPAKKNIKILSERPKYSHR